ncbi:hypothetical protein [Leucobacter sp. NPDC077196]|uniref:hypothetical protein n=1 Tax=Leucobacter sp. NPDC077196 TaxID=3154959 RepID=UPI003437C375
MTNQKTPEQGALRIRPREFGDIVYIETRRDSEPPWLFLRQEGETVYLVNADGQMRDINGSFVGHFGEVQGGATEEQIEAAIEHALEMSDDVNHGELCGCGQWPVSCAVYETHPYVRPWAHDAEFVAREALRFSASVSAHPADERHDAEEREAESEDHAATVTSEREKLIAEARRWPREQDVEPSRPPAELINDLADALAAPVEVDEAKLAEVLQGVLVVCSARLYITGEPLARAAVERRPEWLRGEGR